MRAQHESGVAAPRGVLTPASALALPIRFGAFELDFERRDLRRDGALVELQPTPLRVLLHLAEHRDRIVSRQDLLDAVWPDAVVGDQALTTALAEARRAVEDDGEAQRVIRTHKGAGYRFVAEATVAIQPAAGAQEAGLAQGAASADAQDRQRARVRAALAAAAGVLALAAIGAAIRLQPEAPPAPSPFGIAVLPIADLTAAAADQGLADGLTEQITQVLAESGYPVVARTTASLWRERAADVRELDATLGVSHVLEGSVRREGERVRVSMQLIATDSGKLVWAEGFEQAAGDPFEVQDRLADRVVFAVFGHVAEGAEALKRDPELVKVGDLMVESRRLSLEGRNDDALVALERLLAMTPEREPFVRLRADAVAAMSSSWANLYFWGSRPLREAGPKMLELAEAAVALAPDAPNARHSLVRAQLHHWRWEAAEREAQRVCELAPRSGECGLAKLFTCMTLGCVESELDGARLFLTQTPRDPRAPGALSMALLHNGALEEAEAVSRRAFAVDPRLAGVQPNLEWRLGLRAEAVRSGIQLLAAFGRQEAVHELTRRGEESPESAWRWFAEQYAARKLHIRNQSDYWAAVHLFQLGDVEPALDALERSVARHEAGMEGGAVDPVWDPIRDTTRFRALIEQMGLTAYHEKYGVWERARR